MALGDMIGTAWGQSRDTELLMDACKYRRHELGRIQPPIGVTSLYERRFSDP
jgi:hypothetical protein